MLSHTAYIALGSNLGDRHAYIHQAIEYLDNSALITIEQSSPIIETNPVGPVVQGNYLNAVTGIKTELGPFQILELMLNIERQLGRIRGEKWGPRTIDLDLIIYDQLIINNDPRLILPHPRMHERYFVLQPLAAIAPDLIHPVIGKSIARILSQLHADSTSQAHTPSPPSVG